MAKTLLNLYTNHIIGSSLFVRISIGKSKIGSKRDEMKRKVVVLIVVVGLAGVIGLSMQLSKSQNNPRSVIAPKVFVGGDLHTLSINGSQLIISGHESTAISMDLGRNWKAIKPLDGADVMAWATSASTTFAGGHNGLYISPLQQNNFKRSNFYGELSDVHALGASGDYVYLASPAFGLLASQDGGQTWLPRNTGIGQNFMGSMLVDPSNPLKILAPDMQSGVLASIDGGKTWRSLGGPMGTMAIAWNPSDIAEITVLGMAGAQTTNDNGTTWNDISIPNGAAAITYSLDGHTLFVAALDEPPYAHVFMSTDGGKSWSISSSSSGKTKELVTKTQSSAEMDPNMPGMDHSTTSNVSEAVAERPLTATLGLFGVASSIVMSSAFLLRRRDKTERERKLSQRKTYGAIK